MVITTLCIGARSSIVTFTRFTNLRKLRLSFPVYVVNRKFEKLVRKFYLGLNCGNKRIITPGCYSRDTEEAHGMFEDLSARVKLGEEDAARLRKGWDELL